MAKTDTPKWYSEDGTNIRVILPDGRVAVVGENPRELPRAFYKAAARAGCFSTSQVRIAPEPEARELDPINRRSLIKEAIKTAALAEEGDARFEKAFTAQGYPNMRWLSDRVGFTVEASERDELWKEVQQELDAAEAANAGED